MLMIGIADCISDWIGFLKLHAKDKLGIPKQAENRFVGESATLLNIFDLLCCFRFHEQAVKKNVSLEIPPKTGDFHGIRKNL